MTQSTGVQRGGHEEQIGRWRPGFYQGRGFSSLSGPGAGAVLDTEARMEMASKAVGLKGNLFEPVVTADFPNAPTFLPVNWLALPNHLFDYCMINMEPGSEWPVHVHGYGEEVYVVIDGEGHVVLGEQTYMAGQYDVFHIPAGVPHGMRSASDGGPFRILAINAPAVPRHLRSSYWAVHSAGDPE